MNVEGESEGVDVAWLGNEGIVEEEAVAFAEKEAPVVMAMVETEDGAETDNKIAGTGDKSCKERDVLGTGNRGERWRVAVAGTAGTARARAIGRHLTWIQTGEHSGVSGCR